MTALRGRLGPSGVTVRGPRVVPNKGGSAGSWPVTGTRVGPPSSPAPGHRRPTPAPHPMRRSSWCCGCASSSRSRPGRRRGHHRLAPPASPRHGVVAATIDQPDPGPPRHGHSRPVEAAQVVLHPVRSRTAERHLAVRLHPLPPHQTRPRPGCRLRDHHWLDDHSRYALHVSAHARVTAQTVLATFREAAAEHGYPASTLTDNGMVYTVRFASRPGGRNHLEHELRRLNIVQKNSRSNRPSTSAMRRGSSRPSRSGSAPVRGNRPRPPSSKPCSTNSPPSTTSDARTGPCPTARRRPRATPPAPRRRPHRPDQRHPRPSPPRQDQQIRHRHPARRGLPTPHRRRPNLCRNLRHPARPRPTPQSRQRRHRRTPPRPGHRPPARLPAHRSPQRRPYKELVRTYDPQVRTIPMF